MRLRALFVALVVLWLVETPGVGVDTRPSDNLALGAIFTAAFLVVLAGLAATWWRKAWAPALAMVGGAAALLLAVADLAGLLNPVPPSPLLAALDIGVAIVGAALIWSGVRLRTALA